MDALLSSKRNGSHFAKKAQLHEHATSIQALPDLSVHTLQRRKNVISITKALRNHDTVYGTSENIPPP